jgi:hypothetical protein
LRQACSARHFLAKTPVEVAYQVVPRNIGLRILTTDHGWMIGSALRKIDMPEDFIAEGRAAYREQCGPVPAPALRITWFNPTA